MSANELSRIAELIGSDTPQASVLVPDVRSGATFSYSGTGTTAQTLQFYQVVWIYTVEPSNRATFAANVQTLESTPGGQAGSALPDPGATGIVYRGTYAVSVSSAAPDFEYRTFWGLTDLSKIGALNDHIRNAPADLRNVLGLISPRPAMRTEIMGLVRISAPMTGGL